jgi:NhaA family Na+:H+ antiporter
VIPPHPANPAQRTVPMDSHKRDTRHGSTFRRFLKSEAAGGLALMVSAAAALAVANSPLAEGYHALQDIPIGELSLLHWINDGLMALFFLLVGLEIKRELLDGHLQHWSDRILPGAAALGGMAAPALVYVVINYSSPETLRGWAIPSATDIAFALGVLALMGSRAPGSLKVFLTALAILDDLGAILIIGVFYAGALAAKPLAAAGLTLFLLLGLNLFDVKRLTPYVILGAARWYFVEHSGVHATIAGVLLAAAVPLRLLGPDGDEHTPLHNLENALQPWVAFLIVPLFGFFNAGVTIGEANVSLSGAPVMTGVAAGLFLGKQAGVFLMIALMVMTGLAKRPAHTSWPQIYGVAALCGVGFTMSLFIGEIAFGASESFMTQVKLGVLAGSLLSIALGVILLLVNAKPIAPKPEPAGAGN